MASHLHDERPGEPVDPATVNRAWGLYTSLAIGAILAFGLLVGVVLLPAAQRSNAGLGLWDAICRAVGIQPGTPAQRQPVSFAQAAPVSQVAWSPDVLSVLSSADVRGGEQLATEVCSACHGEQGVSNNAQFPYLAGQSARAIYKQLHDYKTGARYNEQMTPVAARLSDRQLAQISAYYHQVGRKAGLGVRFAGYDPVAVRLAEHGDPARNLPACNSCHLANAGGPTESPVLLGQHAEYVTRQLQLYATRQRQNDVYQRMRNVAGKLTPDEMQRLGIYYQGYR